MRPAIGSMFAEIWIDCFQRAKVRNIFRLNRFKVLRHDRHALRRQWALATLCSFSLRLAFRKLKALLAELENTLLACELLPAATCDAQLMPAIAQ